MGTARPGIPGHLPLIIGADETLIPQWVEEGCRAHAAAQRAQGLSLTATG
jgi:hypothetical protein